MRKLANIQGRFMLISKHDLLVDRENYQRDPKVVKKILKEGWDWPQAGALNIGHREDGKFYIYDGGSRHESAMNIPEVDILPCMVYESEGAAEEAGTFVGVNINRVRLSGLDKHKGRLIAKDAVSAFVDKLLQRAEMYSVKASKCVQILTDLANTTDGKDQLNAIWPLICGTWNGRMLHSNALRGLYWIESNCNQSLSAKKWIDAARRAGPDALDFAWKQGSATKGSAPNWGKGIMERLNKNMKVRLKEVIREDV